MYPFLASVTTVARPLAGRANMLKFVAWGKACALIEPAAYLTLLTVGSEGGLTGWGIGIIGRRHVLLK